MKKFSLLSAILVMFFAVNLTSCDIEPVDPALLNENNNGGNNGGGNGGGNENGEFKVNFNGQTFVASTVQAIVTEDYIAISGMKADGSFFQLTVPSDQEGTYTWPATEPEFPGILGMAYMSPDGGNAYIGASDNYGEFANNPDYTDTAELVINEIDTENETISGTFKFTGVRFVDPTEPGNFDIETIEFTQGSFTNISYAADVESPADNEFFAVLDGEDFIPTNIMGLTQMGTISIIGRRGSVENISLSLPDDIEEGTYPLAFFGDYVGIYILDTSDTGTFGSDEGSVTITSHDTANNRIEGTFEFTATMLMNPGSHEITEGTFSVEY